MTAVASGSLPPVVSRSTLTAGAQPITADDVRTALDATATHRGTRLQPLSTVIGDLVTARADTYAGYRRQQGADAAHLPIDFARLITEVIAFATPSSAER